MALLCVHLIQHFFRQANLALPPYLFSGLLRQSPYGLYPWVLGSGLQSSRLPGLRPPPQAQRTLPRNSLLPHLCLSTFPHHSPIIIKTLSSIYFQSEKQIIFRVCCFSNIFLIKIWMRNHCSVREFSQDTTRACQLTIMIILFFPTKVEYEEEFK